MKVATSSALSFHIKGSWSRSETSSVLTCWSDFMGDKEKFSSEKKKREEEAGGAASFLRASQAFYTCSAGLQVTALQGLHTHTLLRFCTTVWRMAQGKEISITPTSKQHERVRMKRNTHTACRQKKNSHSSKTALLWWNKGCKWREGSSRTKQVSRQSNLHQISLEPGSPNPTWKHNQGVHVKQLGALSVCCLARVAHSSRTSVLV